MDNLNQALKNLRIAARKLKESSYIGEIDVTYARQAIMTETRGLEKFKKELNGK